MTTLEQLEIIVSCFTISAGIFLAINYTSGLRWILVALAAVVSLPSSALSGSLLSAGA